MNTSDGAPGTRHTRIVQSVLALVLIAVLLPAAVAEDCGVNAPNHGSMGTCPATLRVNSSCTPDCDEGYTLAGLMTCIVANEDASGAECRPSVCAAPAAPSGNHSQQLSQTCVEGEAIASGSTCTTRCFEGYVPSPTSLDCAYGTLQPAGYSCEPMTCAAPLGVPKALAQVCQEDLQEFQLGANCTPQCEVGYRPTVSSLICDMGSWSPSTSFQCVPRICSAPDPPEDGGLSPAELQCAEGKEIAHGSVCTARCASGYSPLPAKLSCGLGSLTPAAFTCIHSHCQAPAALGSAPSSCVEGDSISHGGACTPNCATGFYPSVALLHCLHGELQPKAFECIAGFCEAPTAVRDATDPPCFEGSSVKHGMACTASCLSGFRPTFTALSCGLGKLVPESFSCVPIKCAAPVVANSKVAGACFEGEVIESGHSCTPQCQTGYASSQSLLRCELGVFSPPSFACEPSACTSPTAVAHSRTIACMEGSSIGHGGVCTASCALGYHAFPTYLSCGLGRLTPLDFTCTQMACAAPADVSHVGTPACVEGNSVHVGSACTASCAEGFLPSPAKLVCQRAGAGATLSPDSFSCVPAACAAPRGITNALEPGCAEGGSVTQGFACTTLCMGGFVPSVASLKCELTGFAPAAFTCESVAGEAESKVVMTQAEFAVMVCVSSFILIALGVMCGMLCGLRYGGRIKHLTSHLGGSQEPRIGQDVERGHCATTADQKHRLADSDSKASSPELTKQVSNKDAGTANPFDDDVPRPADLNPFSENVEFSPANEVQTQASPLSASSPSPSQDTAAHKAPRPKRRAIKSKRISTAAGEASTSEFGLGGVSPTQDPQDQDPSLGIGPMALTSETTGSTAESEGLPLQQSSSGPSAANHSPPQFGLHTGDQELTNFGGAYGAAEETPSTDVQATPPLPFVAQGTQHCGSPSVVSNTEHVATTPSENSAAV